MTRLIGLNGRLHSGKDTIYGMIAELAEFPKRVAFADKLKVSACAALGIPYVDTADAVHLCNMIKEQGKIVVCVGDQEHLITGREYLQWYGTESHRNVFGQDFWVDALLPPWDGMAYTASTFWPGSDVVVITDVRFPNEADRILEHGGEVWWIDAEERLGRLPYDAHVSEQPLDPQLITAVLDNNGSLNRLREGVETLYELQH